MKQTTIEQEMVTITLSEYERLTEAYEWLGYLEAAGVDNWPGMEEAHRMKKEDEREQ